MFTVNLSYTWGKTKIALNEVNQENLWCLIDYLYFYIVFYWNKIVSSFSYNRILLFSSSYLFPHIKYLVIVKYILWRKDKQEDQQRTNRGFVTSNSIFNIFVNK